MVVKEIHGVLKDNRTIEGHKSNKINDFSHISAEGIMRPIDPEEEFVLVVGVEVVVDGSLVVAADSFVADEKVSAMAQAHENVIIEVPKRDDVLETESQRVITAERLLVALALERRAEEARRRAIHYFRQNLLVDPFPSGFRWPSAIMSIVVRFVVARCSQSFLYHRSITYI
jgi:hypothetical protein